MNSESIFSVLPDTVSIDLETWLDMTPDNISSIDFLSTLKLIILIILVTVTIGIVIRLLLGKGSSFNRAVSTGIGILWIYAVTIVIYTVRPANLNNLLSPLPFAVFHQDLLYLIPFHSTSFSALANQIVSLLVLSFLVNMLDSFLPQGKNVITWFLLRILFVVIAMFLNLTANWAFNTYLPGFLSMYAPVILLSLLILFLLLGVSKTLLSIILTAVNPFIGALYTFFFSNIVGKQLTKAVLSTLILCLFFWFVEYNGYTVIEIHLDALLSYIPFAGALFILWFLLGHEL